MSDEVIAEILKSFDKNFDRNEKKNFFSRFIFFTGCTKNCNETKCDKKVFASQTRLFSQNAILSI